MRGWSLASTSHSYYSSPTYDVSVGDILCLVIGYGPINRIGLRRDVCSNKTFFVRRKRTSPVTSNTLKLLFCLFLNHLNLYATSNSAFFHPVPLKMSLKWLCESLLRVVVLAFPTCNLRQRFNKKGVNWLAHV